MREPEEKGIEKIFRQVRSTSLDGKIRKEVKQYGINIVHRKENTLFSKIRSDKEQQDKLDRTGVYIIPLERKVKNNEIEHAGYIGMTLKSVKLRMKQHKENIRKQDATTSLVTAIMYENWRPDWDSVKLLVETNTYWRTVLSEFIQINTSKIPLVNTRESTLKYEKWLSAICTNTVEGVIEERNEVNNEEYDVN